MLAYLKPRPVEMKRILGGGGDTNYVILSATMISRRRKRSILSRLKRLEKLNVCWREVMYISINKQEFIGKLFRVSTQSLEFFEVYGGLKFRFEVLNVFII